MVRGELIGALAFTEPNTGSDVANVRTSAVQRGDAWIVNGSKTFITNGINSDLVITTVRTNDQPGHRGLSLLVLERGMKGFERGRNLNKLGMHAQDTAELSFVDVEVPAENMLGVEGQGFVYLMQNLAQERLGMAVGGVKAGAGNNGLLTFPCNLHGNPGISVPAGTVDGLPVGLQIIGPHFSEQVLLELAHVLERERPWPLTAPAAPI